VLAGADGGQDRGSGTTSTVFDGSAVRCGKSPVWNWGETL